MAITSLIALIYFLLLAAPALCPRCAHADDGSEPPQPEVTPSRLLEEPRIGDGKETVGQFLFRKGTEVYPGLTLDASPEGKKVEKILVVPLEVIHPEDPWPKFLNAFHNTTLPEVVERELLFEAGDTWTAARIEETRRNLRNNVFVNAVEVFPCKGSSPDKIVALIVVKDFWSLRTSWTYQFVGSQLVYLDLTAGEFNFRGRKQKLAANFGLDSSTLLWGQEFEDPRAFGSRVLVREKGDLIFNRKTGAPEGHLVSVGVEQPLYSLDAKWAWSATFDARRDIYRLVSGLDTVMFQSPTTGELIPFDYRRETIDARLSVTRSLGRAIKRDISFGWKGSMQRYGMYESAPTYSQAALDDFASRYLPRSENSSALFASYHLYTPAYHQLTNVERYGVTEDVRVGPNLLLEQRVALSTLGFGSATYFETLADLSWTFEGNDNYLTLGFTGSARYQPELGLDSAWVNRTATLRARNVSPKLGPFRLITSARLTRRDLDQTRAFDTLGGNSALRGYPVNYLYGTQSWGANAELRTHPFVFRSTYIGGAAFLDVGDSSDNPTLTTHASVGLGIRLMTPQFARSVMRLDLAFPLEQLAPGISPTYFSAQLAQAFY